MNKRNRNVRYAVTAAAVTAAALAGCRALYQGAATAADASVPPAAIRAAGGVEAVKAHTQVAQELVQRAIPNSNPVGQAQLSAAGIEHDAVLVSADKTAASLEQLKDDFARRGEQLAAAKAELANQQDKQRKLESQWYVLWGIRIERFLWTAAITWLLVSVGSMLLGTGNPASWIGSLRGVISAMTQRWSVSDGASVK